MAVQARLREGQGIDAQAIWSDDGIAFHFPDADDPPPADALLIGCIRETGGDHDKVYEYLGTLDTAKDFHEAGRLLYVAATRAKHRLDLLSG